MMNPTLYLKDIKNTAETNLQWSNLQNSNIVITGANGLLGSYLIDVIMYKNINDNLNCRIYAIGRNLDYAKIIFSNYFNTEFFLFITLDINNSFNLKIDKVDYVIHLASNTHPLAYSTMPIETIATNIIGLKNLLDFSVCHNAKCFVFASSVEIYGENRGDTEEFDEKYCGYIDSNTLRAGYPESKRCGEALCQAYIKQKNLKVIIPRFARLYGPTLLKEDSKALSQFIRNTIERENIVLKSNGEQYYSYLYVGDAISGLLTAMLKGSRGEAYNVADEFSNIHLKDLANILANIANTKVVYEIPNEIERAGYSKATKAVMNGNKLKQLGWIPQYTIKDGLEQTIKILCAIKKLI